jgi:hypothetical protein
MATHGVLLIKGEDCPNGVRLHTSHSGYKIPEVVELAPKVVAKRKLYLKNAEEALNELECDESLAEWFELTECVCALVIGAYSCLLTPVLDNGVRDGDVWELEIKGRLWFLKYPSAKQAKEIDPVKLFAEAFPEK